MPLLKVWIDTISTEILDCRRVGMVPAAAIEQWAIHRYSNRVDPRDLATALPDILGSTAAIVAAEQATWPRVTDCDRLDTVIDDLNARGILARHGAAFPFDVQFEAERLGGVQNGLPIRGLAAYDEDLESVLRGGPLVMGACSITDSRDADAGIMGELIEVLREHGLACAVCDSPVPCVVVYMKWQRRGPPDRWINVG